MAETDRDVRKTPAPPGIVGDAEACRTTDGLFVIHDETPGGWIAVWDPVDLEANR